MENQKKNKHMLLEDRIEIQECLRKGMTFKAIAARIGKDPTTVSKEVKQHSVDYESGYTRIDGICPKLLKAPFICNGCSNQYNAGCKYPRRKYVAKTAQEQYELVLKEAREGVQFNREEFYRCEEIISNAVRSGQNVYHAIEANKLSVSKTSVYRYIEKGYYSIARIDLPRAVKFKQRKEKRSNYVPKGIRVGRQYEDFIDFMAARPDVLYSEMDTVIGSIGGKVIMTFQFIKVDFMFGLLLENKTAFEAAAKIADLKKRLTDAGFNFGQIFPVILTDNGGEFSDVFAFENNNMGNKETSLFFCDPNSPYQKPHVENNHTLFRMIVPKSSSFDEFTQETVNTVFSHVNGVKRKHFNGRSAYEMFTFTYSEKLAEVLGISFVDPKDVIQSPRLLNNILNK